jgi:hypothetical protein
VVVGLRTAEVVHEPQTLFHGVDVAVEELDLVDGSVWSALTAGTVVRDDHDDGVVELAGVLQIVQDAADLGVGVAQETGEHLGHPAEQPLVVVAERVPRSHGVLQGPWFTVGPLDIRVRIDRRQLGVGRDDAEALLVLQHDLAVTLVAHVESARVAVCPLLEDVMRRVTGAGTDIREPRLVGCDHLRVADEFDCLVGDIL